MFMKRLPKKFVIMSRDYLDKGRWAIKIGGITSCRCGGRVWYVNETFASYEYRGHARRAGIILAQDQKIGFIENVYRGDEYKKKHRSEMFLFDR